MDGMWSRYGVKTLGIRGYGGGGDMVVNDESNGCLDPHILRSSPLLPPLPLDCRDCIIEEKCAAHFGSATYLWPFSALGSKIKVVDN
ncbi:hypothetical protein Tco_1457062 [Tanacetum coccineum]